ncbi:MAG: winged helix DNA-binding domain-containing protein [Chloroflexota bacterium]
MKSLTWHEVRGRRLERQYLSKPAPSTGTTGVVSAVCGIQAQMITAAELAIGARVAGITQEDIRRELWEKRSLVKTYGPRSTLHLLPANELPMWMAAMRARASLQDPPWFKSAGLEHEQMRVLLEGIGEALDGKQLTRDELASDVSALVGGWAKEKLSSTWGEMLSPAAFEGLLCFGPSRGSKVTFVRADQWIGTWQEVDPDAALTEVASRYLATYGPATHREFARWFWLDPAEGKRIIESLGTDVAQVEFENYQAWVLAADTDIGETLRTADAGEASVRLLPQYDAYVLGSGPRERIVQEIAHKRIFSYGRGRYEGAVGLPILLIDGEVSGIWERKMRGKILEIRVEPFIELTAAQHRQLEAETARVGKFLGSEANLTLGVLS